MEIDKKYFVKIMKDLEEYKLADEVLVKNLDAFVEGTGFATLHSDKWEELIMNILEHYFDDDADPKAGTWIGYFVYDLDFGKEWKESSATRKDGSSINLSDAGHLYEFLIEEQSNILDIEKSK
jgi:hypothetical protein